MSAKKRQTPEEKDLAPDPWIRALGRRPDEPANAIGLTGYLGKSEKDDHVRLYMDPELRAWIELKKADIIYRERQGGPQSRGSAVMVRQDAPIGRPGHTAADVQGWFLRGQIIDGSLADVQASGGMVVGLLTISPATTLWCATFIITCFLCLTPSCDELTIPPLLCDGEAQPPG